MNWLGQQHHDAVSLERFTLSLFKLAYNSVKGASQGMREHPEAYPPSKLPQVERELFFFFIFSLDHWWQIDRTEKELRHFRDSFSAHLSGPLRHALFANLGSNVVLDSFQERLTAYRRIVLEAQDGEGLTRRLGMKLSEFCDMPGKAIYVDLAQYFFTRASKDLQGEDLRELEKETAQQFAPAKTLGMRWLKFKCKTCGRTGPSGASTELPFLHYSWYTDYKGLVHGCLYCRSCGTVYDTIGPLLGALKMLFGRMPSKITATYEFAALERLTRINNPDFPSLRSIHPAILMAMEEDGRLTEAEDLMESPTLDFLVECLSDDNFILRREAITALGRLGHTQAVEPLMKALRDKHWDVRRTAAFVLGEMGDTRAVEALDQLLLNEKWEAYVRREAKTALEKLRRRY